VEGGHPQIGGELARKYGEDATVVNAIEAHHDEQLMTSIYTRVVQAADAVSGARPGARRRTLEKYLMRIEQIEQIATAPHGVEGAHVIQAGREVRVNVNPEKVSDEDAQRISVEIARNLEKEMSFPGTIKVTVIRENKVTAFAR
jgi:ribonuclease Y